MSSSFIHLFLNEILEDNNSVICSCYLLLVSFTDTGNEKYIHSKIMLNNFADSPTSFSPVYGPNAEIVLPCTST